MRDRRLLYMAVGLWLMVASDALAQSPPALAASPSASESPAAPAETPPAQRLEEVSTDQAIGILGKKVKGPAQEDMGLVVDVLVDRDGAIKAAVIDFGGFLGVGRRRIAIDWRFLHMHPGDAETPVTLDLGRQDIQGAPEYKPPADKAPIIAPTIAPPQPVAAPVPTSSDPLAPGAAPTLTPEK